MSNGGHDDGDYDADYFNSTESFDVVLFDVDTWLTITLSIVSCSFLISFTIIYMVDQIQSRDHAKETRKVAFKKMLRNEYLVFSYCSSLLFSHLLNMTHSFLLKFYFSKFYTRRPPLSFNVTTTTPIWLPETTTTTPCCFNDSSTPASTSNHSSSSSSSESSMMAHEFAGLLLGEAAEVVADRAFVVARNYCLVIGVLKHFFWLLSMFHSNVMSVKIYIKITKSTQNTLLSKKFWLRTACKHFTYIYGLTSLIIVVSLLVQFLAIEVYEMRFHDRMTACFLTQPTFLLGFFALPIIVILGVNFTLYMIIVVKTKKTIDKAENHEMNHLYPKLAIVMGFSWVIYIVSTLIQEIFLNYVYVKAIVVIGSCQINLQGTFVVFGLYSNAVYVRLFKKKKKPRKKPRSQHQNQVQPQNRFVNRMTAF